MSCRAFSLSATLALSSLSCSSRSPVDTTDKLEDEATAAPVADVRWAEEGVAEEATATAAPHALNRIWRGKRVELRSRPYAVALARGSTVFCGGTMVARGWVLTAAHCLPDTEVTVLANTDNLRDAGRLKRLAISRVVDFPDSAFDCPDPRTNCPSMEDDIVLLQLEDPGAWVPRNNSGPVVFPTLPSASAEVAPTSELTTAGWGKTSEFGEASIWLLEVGVAAVDRTACASAYPTGWVTPSMVCATSREGDTCGGDSGGPLLDERDGKLELVGIVSNGSAKGCGSGEPAVYTQVSKYLDFITTTTAG